jgi:hypothetical protein
MMYIVRLRSITHTHTLTHTLTHSLTHLLTYSLTHLLTHSLTHLLIGVLYRLHRRGQERSNHTRVLGSLGQLNGRRQLLHFARQ